MAEETQIGLEWRQDGDDFEMDSELCAYTLYRGKQALGSVEFDTGRQRWQALDYTHQNNSPAGCVLLTGFVDAGAAQAALEASVRA